MGESKTDHKVSNVLMGGVELSNKLKKVNHLTLSIQNRCAVCVTAKADSIKNTPPPKKMSLTLCILNITRSFSGNSTLLYNDYVDNYF